MDSQQDLFALSEPPRPRYNVFLAVMPDEYSAQGIYEFAGGIRARHRLNGELRPRDHLHVSMHGIGEFSEIPERLVQTVGEACHPVVAGMAPFPIRFDRVLSFNSALVLANGGCEELTSLYQALGRALILGGFKGISLTGFTPHVTMLYAPQRVPEERVATLGWRVNEVRLVCSEFGKTKYDFLGQWSLGAAG